MAMNHQAETHGELTINRQNLFQALASLEHEAAEAAQERGRRLAVARGDVERAEAALTAARGTLARLAAEGRSASFKHEREAGRIRARLLATPPAEVAEAAERWAALEARCLEARTAGPAAAWHKLRDKVGRLPLLPEPGPAVAELHAAMDQIEGSLALRLREVG